LNILFITQDDPFYIPHFFREFFAHCQNREIKVHGIVIQAPLGKKSLGGLMKQMLAFYGWFDFLRVGCKFVFYKVMNAVATRLFAGQFPGTFSLEHFLLKNRIPIVHCPDVNAASFIDTIKSLDLDLIVSVAASQKFKRDLLGAPRYGCINVHNSRLPRNRGMLPNFWSLYQFDTEPVSAMTVHKMNDTLDDGAIVIQEDLRLDPAESLEHLIVRTKKLNAHLILKALSLFKAGEPPLLANDASKATYNSFPTREDVKRFRAKGLRIL
jgi:methionyl-tRNA formyltransferase